MTNFKTLKSSCGFQGLDMTHKTCISFCSEWAPSLTEFNCSTRCLSSSEKQASRRADNCSLLLVSGPPVCPPVVWAATTPPQGSPGLVLPEHHRQEHLISRIFPWFYRPHTKAAPRTVAAASPPLSVNPPACESLRDL